MMRIYIYNKYIYLCMLPLYACVILCDSGGKQGTVTPGREIVSFRLRMRSPVYLRLIWTEKHQIELLLFVLWFTMLELVSWRMHLEEALEDVSEEMLSESFKSTNHFGKSFQRGLNVYL